MLITFWLGLTLSFLASILLMVILGWITKKIKGSGAIGGLIGFFIGFALVMFVAFGSRRAYVVIGDQEYVHYMVFGSPEYSTKAGTKVVLNMNYDECYVINESEDPVVIEEAVYGGYGFGGATHWVQAGEQGIMSEHKIDYFYDNEPPDEISVSDDSEQTVRLWLRKKRE